ncbi:MAG: hypothetical protein WA274_02305 [Candidatus Acidiferrales bacterium]
MLEDQMSTTQRGWFEVDKEGLQQTMGRKSKSFALFELLQNAFDEEGCENVTVTLPEPVDGLSVLTVTDDAPDGYKDMSTAHTLFAKSYKKTDPTKRGRFNLGEKLVLAICDEATITSTSGQTIFLKDGTRTVGVAKTEVGSIFRGVLPLTPEEFESVKQEVRRVIAPIRATFNGEVLQPLQPIRTFSATLATEVADEKGIMRTRQRKTDVKLYPVAEGGEAYLYEKGLPVCPIDAKWSIEVWQKVPVNLERDSVSDAYKAALYVACINEMHDELTQDDMGAIWVQRALEDERISHEATKKILTTQFGENVVLQDLNDRGSNLEAAAAGQKVIPRGALNRKQLANMREKAGLMTASKAADGQWATDHEHKQETMIPEAQWSTDMKRYAKLIRDVAPFLLSHPLAGIRVCDDESLPLLGCTRWGKKQWVMTVNIAHHNEHDWVANYDLLVHEFAHFREQSNSHISEGFWRAATIIGAKLSQLVTQKPKLFKGTGSGFSPEKYKPFVDENMQADQEAALELVGALK